MTLRRKTDRHSASGRGGENDQPGHTVLPLARYFDEKREEEHVEQPDLTQLGEHVTSVLAAAEAAAVKLRKEAEDDARSSRADADSYAETRRREADAQATRIVRDAENRSSQLADSAAERHRVLLADISASENRMRHLATSLREVANRLDEVAKAGDDGERAETLDRTLAERVADESTRVESVS